ncbi:MAG TPA: hypothetical protein VHA09_06095 [Nitrososphaera sp.]|nr:hypothetical protein [Nitrososphaera sp.]
MSAETASLHKSTKLTNSTYDLIMALATDADFLYSTVDSYIADARNDNRSDLVGVWNTIKQDKQNHMKMLREALAIDAKQERFK